jgi:hypothetical protein
MSVWGWVEEGEKGTIRIKSKLIYHFWIHEEFKESNPLG